MKYGFQEKRLLLSANQYIRKHQTKQYKTLSASVDKLMIVLGIASTYPRYCTFYMTQQQKSTYEQGIISLIKQGNGL